MCKRLVLCSQILDKLLAKLRKIEMTNVLKAAAHGGILATVIVGRIIKIRQQESCVIAKMTAQCALHMGALKIFGTP